MTFANPAVPLHKRGQFFISPDEGRETPLTLDVEPCLAPAGPHNLKGRDWRVPLDGQFTQVERVEVACDQPMRRGAGQYAAGLRGLLEPRGHIRRVTDRCVVHAEVVANFAHDHGTGVESDSHLEGALQARGQLAAQVTDAAL